jgi:hypothetical protein
MPDGDIAKIRIGGNLVGIVGLNEAIAEVAECLTQGTDDEIKEELLKRLAGRNYIPSRVNELYGKAVLRAFRKYLGQPVSDESVEGVHVAVLGPGCAQCSQLEIDVREVMAEMELPGELIHISDFKEIARFGIMGVPALVINDKVVCVGAAPHRNKIKEWLMDATLPDRKR